MGKAEALSLIKEAAETGATWLNFGVQGLTELPPELFKLKKLILLNLYGNQLAELPPELFQLDLLHKLFANNF
jgi:Leucine-rich repeat (LRR) protein